MQANNVENETKDFFFFVLVPFLTRDFSFCRFLVFHLAENTRQSGRALSVTILLLFPSHCDGQEDSFG